MARTRSLSALSPRPRRPPNARSVDLVPRRRAPTPAGVLIALVVLAGCTNADDAALVPRTVVDDPTLPRLALADGRLVHLQTFGDPVDPVVIALHGGPGGDHRDQLPLAELADRFFVVLWDQRGTGLSERVPDAELDGPTYLADLHHLGETFSPDAPFHLIGHSWGGTYAAYYVQQHPDRVDRLVLAEPGALNARAAEEVNVAAVDLFDGGTNGFLNTTDYLLPDGDARADYFYVIALAGLNDDRDFLDYDFWRLGYRANVGINTWQGNFDGSYRFDFTTGLDAFEGETLFLAGEADGRLGLDFQLTYHAPFFDDPDVFWLEGATHAEVLRRPESRAAIRAFLEEAPR